jgi:alpha-N-arabinofuranosidase
LYAELIRNRAFQGASSVSPFTAVGGATLSLKSLAQPLSSALPKSMNVAGGSGTVGFSNPGWWGIDVKVQPHKGSFYVKESYSGSFTASLLSASSTVLGSVQIPSMAASGASWTQYNFTLIPTQTATTSNNTFSITYDASVSTMDSELTGMLTQV